MVEVSFYIMTENTMATNFEPHESVIFVQTTKIDTHENKAITVMDLPATSSTISEYVLLATSSSPENILYIMYTVYRKFFSVGLIFAKFVTSLKNCQK